MFLYWANGIAHIGKTTIADKRTFFYPKYENIEYTYAYRNIYVIYLIDKHVTQKLIKT